MSPPNEPPSPQQQLQQQQQRKLELEKRKAEIMESLPHLYKWKWYWWAKKFFDSRNRMNLLCAANQISKSTTAIRKNIHWATDKRLWPKIWPKSPNPSQFWYLYPSQDTASSEFKFKWLPEVMPRIGEFSLDPEDAWCHHPIYGWEAVYAGRHGSKYGRLVTGIKFTSGVTIFFKAYTQNVHHLQSGTVHMITCDEELPEDLYDELKFRLAATDGVFNMVFTATRNQLLWYLALEGRGSNERFPDALKLQISMDDCQVYEDGSPGHYTQKRIEKIISDCRDEAEIDRRVRGRFVKDSAVRYSSFDPIRHMVKPISLPKGVRYFGGVDIGSGGSATAHPSAIGIIAVQPDFRRGWVIAGKRYDRTPTTAGDVFLEYIRIRGDRQMMIQTADPCARDFHVIAERSGETFLKPERNMAWGADIVNTLFRNDMLFIFDIPELQPLATELMTLKDDTNKSQAKDDFIDAALRYPCSFVPWDWSAIRNIPSEEEIHERLTREEKAWTPEKALAEQIRQRRGEIEVPGDDNWKDLIEELGDWNEAYGT